MSDGQIISLEERRGHRSTPVSGSMSFRNDQLRLPFSKVRYGPRWTVSAQAQVDGVGAIAIDASLVAEALDEDTPMGWVSRNEHALSAEFVVGEEYAALVQQLALSPVPFDLNVAFSADEEGAVQNLVFLAQRA